MTVPLLDVRGLKVHFSVRRSTKSRDHMVLRAVDGVDLEVKPGECVGIVGESGCGKTTLARAVLGLLRPTAGSIRFDGVDLMALGGEELRRLRRRFQMVFQDSASSLSPRMSVRELVSEPLVAHGIVPRRELVGRVSELLEEVALGADLADRLPNELSGGQQQRVAIARALASRPDLLVADEPLSSVDSSMQARLVDLLQRARENRNLALLLIAHDLAVVGEIADRVVVLYCGKIVESGSPSEVFEAPLHPYTAALVSAVPVPDPGARRRRIVLPGDPPSPTATPAGCAFHPRCPIALERCGSEPPPSKTPAFGRKVACHTPGDLQLSG